MLREDRLFAIIGGAVVAAVTTLFVVFAGGITGPDEGRTTVVVAPIPSADAPTPASDVVRARVDRQPGPAGDDVVRAVLAGLAAHPEWAGWLVTDDLVGRFVAAVEAVADGYSPREQLDFLAPWRPFIVREGEGRLVIASGSYRRYDLAAAVIDSVDADAAVALYRRLEPEIVDARRDVAWHRGDFEDRLQAAIDHLLEVEFPTGPVEVEQRTRAYVFADDRLEGLSDAQRQLLRMGADNAARVQHKLRQIRTAFGWPDRAPPGELRRALDETDGAATPEHDPARIARIETGAEELGIPPPIAAPLTPVTAGEAPMTSAAVAVAGLEPAPVAVADPAPEAAGAAAP